MSIRVNWDDNDHTVLRIVYQGQWTLEAFRSTGMEAIQMVRSTGHPVYVISDFTETTELPVGVLWGARDLEQNRPPNWGAGISIITDALTKDLLELFGEVYMGARRERVFIVQTSQEALETICRLKSENQAS